jgi:hypothetical protein
MPEIYLKSWSCRRLSAFRSRWRWCCTGVQSESQTTSSELQLVLKPAATKVIALEPAVDVQEVRKLDAYLKRLFGNPKIRVVPRPKKDDSAEVYIGEEFIGVLFVDDEDDDRSFQFQMAILEDDLVEQE